MKRPSLRNLLLLLLITTVVPVVLELRSIARERSVLAPVGSPCGRVHDRPMEPDMVRMTLFDRRSADIIKADTPLFVPLCQEAERMFVDSTDILYELVTDDTVENIRRAGALELIYGKPVEVQVNNAYLGRTTIDRLLISLTGDSSTVLYGLGKYGSGPVVSPQNMRLKEMMREGGWLSAQ